MIVLKQQHCELSRSDSVAVSDTELKGFINQIPDWQILERDNIRQLERTFRFASYRAALIFTQRVGELAEAEDHHPVIVTEWGRVRVSWWTHTIRGLHLNDLICAAKTDQLAD